MIAQLRFYFDDKGLMEDWWYPIRILQLVQEDSNWENIENQIYSSDKNDILSSMMECNAQLSKLYLYRTALQLESQMGSIPASLNYCRLSNLLLLVARQHINGALPSVVQSNEFLDNFKQKLISSCNNKNIAECILLEALKFLRSSVATMMQNTISIELVPNTSPQDLPKKITIQNCTAIFLGFDYKAKLSHGDTLQFYMDKECTKHVATVIQVRILLGISIVIVI
jgi:hypothetical protein